MSAPDALYAPLMTVDTSQFELRPLHLGIYFGAFSIDTRDKFDVLAATFRVARQHLAPLMVKAAVDILPHLQKAVSLDPRTRIIFTGRDSFGLGYVISALDREFSVGHCRSLYLTRAIVDAALSDLESLGHDFTRVEAFRKRATGLPRTEAWADLQAYFEAADLQLSGAGPVILVDTGYKGSIQEMLAAAYPTTEFTGHYIFFSAAPEDPHPGTKRGHLLSADSGPAAGGRALRGPLPRDPSLTFAHHEAIVAVEELLQGSQLSPTVIDPTGRPRLRRARRTDDPYEGLNPVLIAEEYADPVMREAVLSFNVLAVSRLAIRVAAQVDTSIPGWYEAAVASAWYADLADCVVGLRDQLRGWISGAPGPAVDPVLRRMLDSFVHRSDRLAVRALADRLRGHPVDAQAQAWVAFDRRETIEAKTAFSPDQAPDTPVPLPPVLRRRDRTVATLRGLVHNLSPVDAHRLAALLMDDLDAIQLAARPLSTGMTADEYIAHHRACVDDILAADPRVVARLPVLAAEEVVRRHDG